MNLDTVCNIGLWETACAGGSYLAAAIHKRPETSLENFYINRFGKKLYEMFFKGYTKRSGDVFRQKFRLTGAVRE
ncbi:MAG: hypothetical protein ACLR8P_12845 [Clostridium fessum]